MAFFKPSGDLLHVLCLLSLMFAIELTMAMVVARVLAEVTQLRAISIVSDKACFRAVFFVLIRVLLVFVGDIGFNIDELVAMRSTSALALRLSKADHVLTNFAQTQWLTQGEADQGSARARLSITY